jgi:hypothetical protein
MRQELLPAVAPTIRRAARGPIPPTQEQAAAWRQAMQVIGDGFGASAAGARSSGTWSHAASLRP